MSDAQSWTLIAGFLAILVAMTGMTLRVARTSFDSLSIRIDGMERRLNDRIDGLEQRLDQRIDGVRARLGTQLAALDRDVQRLVEDRFRGPS